MLRMRRDGGSNVLSTQVGASPAGALHTGSLPDDTMFKASMVSPPLVDSIYREFDDPLLEVLRLLREASEIEHALLVQYLYAAFSVKPAYREIVGFGFPTATDLLGVAVQEMQHLSVVNAMLAALGGAPNLIRQDFPYEPEIYPFALNLEPLSLRSIAKYTYTEAPAGVLNRDDPANATERPFLDRLFTELGDLRPNHLGSLYGTIIARAAELQASQVPGLTDLTPWIAKLEWVRGQGEHEHYRFFRSLFLAEHRGFLGRSAVWSLPMDDAEYPAIQLPLNPSALRGQPNQIQAHPDLEIARLGNLHYWLVLALLDLAYRTGNGTALGLSKAHMTGPLLACGRALAARTQGLPFNVLSMGYALGVTDAQSTTLIKRMLREVDALQASLSTVLPPDFPTTQAADSLAVLGE